MVPARPRHGASGCFRGRASCGLDLILITFLAVPFASLTAWQEPVPSEPRQPLRSGVAAIVVDAVVRDGKGTPITDLRKEDFELFEDGVRQEIGDVTIVMPGPAARGSRTAGTVDTPEPTRPRARSNETPARAAGVSFLAMVFDRLTPEARGLAYKGALAYLDTPHEGDYAAVFLSDLTLKTIQPYTNNRAKLRTALRVVASRATSVFDRTATRRLGDSQSSGDANPSVPAAAGAESAGRPVDNRGGFAGEVIELDLSTHNSWEAMARDQQGYATTNALLAVTTALGALPGRKSVVFFAEGLSIPDAVLPHFRSVVTNANRGNVSVYTIDAAGLRVHSKDAEIGREVRAMGGAGLTVNALGENGSSLGTMEHNEDVLRKDPRTSLTLLAQQTGGFLVDGTNDLGKAFRQIDADRRFHYLLTYTPKNGDFDGKWRSVTVKVPKRRLNIRARSGYLAARAPAAVPLLAYEGPALAALERVPAPADLPLRTAALVFPDGAQSRIVILAATDATALHFDRNSRTETYRTDFNIVARIVDSHGDTIRQSSQPYRLTGAAQQLGRARQGEVLFFRQPALAAGSYTLEVALHDALATRSAVRRTTFVVPETSASALQVSSLVLVRRAERVPAEAKPERNPLIVGDVLIYPSLDEPFRKSEDKTLSFFLAVSPGAGVAPQATVEILRDGRILAQAPSRLPAADAAGLIQHIAEVSVDALAEGQYALRLTVSQGERREVREAAFALMNGESLK